MFSNNEIHENLLRIASDYELFQCQECADHLRSWLDAHEVHGVYMRIETYGRDFMISKRVGPHMTVTQNGYHYGVEVNGLVYDNLPDTGIPKIDWVDDFECLDGFDIVEIPF